MKTPVQSFSLDEKLLYTIQNPYKGPCFLSVWQLQSAENALQPIKTLKLHEYPASASCLSREGLYLGVGFSDGAKKTVNLRHYDVEASSKPHDIVVKGVGFSQDSRFLATGAVDATYNFALLDRKEGFFSKFSKFVVLLAFLTYFLMFFSENVEKLSSLWS